MIAFLIPTAVGVVLILIGISNMKGNIESIHSYHRKRVTEENKAAFGKLMGLGSIVCGAGVIAFGVLSILAEAAELPVLLTVGAYLTVACLAVGIGMLTYATLKYNKGIF